MKQTTLSALETLLHAVGESPELARVLFGTNALYNCVEAYATATGGDPGTVMRGLRERHQERMHELSLRRVDVHLVRSLPDEFVKVGGCRRYKGWLIKRPGAERYLCFTPDNVDYPEEGYEDIEFDSADAAKEWIDNYPEE